MEGSRSSECVVLIAVVAMVSLLAFGMKRADLVLWPVTVVGSAYILSRGLGKRGGA